MNDSFHCSDMSLIELVQKLESLPGMARDYEVVIDDGHDWPMRLVEKIEICKNRVFIHASEHGVEKPVWE